MLQQTFAIARNTFLESIRQPIMLVILVVATILIILANPLSAFTMTNDQRMYLDMGLATVFLCGALLSAFIATNVLGREIENRTALTVISKPVNRPLFVIGKYLGVAGALTVATLYMSFVFLLAEQHSVLQTVRDPIHAPVILFGVGAAVIGLGIGIWCNYFYDKVFSSTVICFTTPLVGLAYVFSLMFKHNFTTQPISEGFKTQLWIALLALLIAILVMTAIAVAASTRLNQILTLGVTIGVFLMGMMSDWFFGRQIVRLEQSWTERAENLSEKQVQTMLAHDNVQSLQHWVRDVHERHAQHLYSLWHCHALAEIYKQEVPFKRLTPADREATKRVIETQKHSESKAQFDFNMTEANARAALVQWPPRKEDVVLRLDWPRMVERPTGECETISETQTIVYPRLQNALVTGNENAMYGMSRAGYAIVPNFQVLMLSDAVTQEHLIPANYLGKAAMYGGSYIAAALAFAVVLFQRREVG